MIFRSLWFWKSLLLVLCFLAPAQTTKNIQHTVVNCQNASKVALSKNKQIITFRSNEYNEHCSWTIPKSVQTDEYAVVILLENVTLTKLKEGCPGELRFPKIGGYKCEFTQHYCLAYATSATQCELEKINKKSLQNYTSTCTDFTHWTRTETAKIEYFAADKANIHKEFVLHYIPINCIEPTTTTSTTTSTATTTRRTTTTRTTTTKTRTKSPSTPTSAITATSSIAKIESTTNSISTTKQSSTEPQAQAAAMDVSTIGLLVGATALVMILAIGLILHRKKQKVLKFPDIPVRNFRKTDEMEFYEEYEGNTQQNKTKNNYIEETEPYDPQESSEVNEVQTEYENTSYQPSEIYTPVVKKR